MKEAQNPAAESFLVAMKSKMLNAAFSGILEAGMGEMECNGVSAATIGEKIVVGFVFVPKTEVASRKVPYAK